MNPEQIAQRSEQIERHITSKIVLKFFRHDRKEVTKEGQADQEVRLTDEGRAHAMEQADLSSIDQAVAFGSPRVRAQETAGFVMAGALDEITGNESLQELKDKIDGERAYGSKLLVDPRLDFSDILTTPYGKKAFDAFNAGSYLKFLITESDQVAHENNDEIASTYERQAQAIAQIVEKYLKVSPRFNGLVADPSKSYSKEMQRFFGTHQGVAESFLAKVIEKLHGEEKRNRFIEILGNQGFGYAEGFTAEIGFDANTNEPVFHVSYKKEGKEGKETFVFDEDVSLEIIHEIAEGR